MGKLPHFFWPEISRGCGGWPPLRHMKPAQPSDHFRRFGSLGLTLKLLLVLRPEILTHVRRAFPDTGGVAGSNALKERLHMIHAGFVANGRVDDRGQRPGTRHTHQGTCRNQVGKVKPWNTQFFGLLHNRGRADGQIGLHRFHGGTIILKRGPELNLHAARFQPLLIVCIPRRPGAGGAHIRDIRPALDQEPRNKQFGSFITR
mmetsp:Transcript_28315/g.52755  ORF Transcript_28315/g.52755 Transcript_28315/m.52755 type:complete len:203 (-) Transcript_28315:1607-2215(-)